MEVKFDGVYFWTDSLTVLHYILNPNLRLKLFVANRVSKILELSEDAIWSHVRTHENPSDIGSRGLSPSNPEAIKPWLEGPSFLRKPKEFWPLTDGSGEIQPAPATLEVKTNVTVAPGGVDQGVKSLSRLFSHFSSLHRLQIAAAWLLRYRNFLRGNLTKQDFKTDITVSELEYANISLIRASQWVTFPHLMRALTESSSQTGSPSNFEDLSPPARHEYVALRGLDPYLDETGVLRVGGRLQHAGLSHARTHPLILPRRHQLTALIITDYHVRSLHQGINYVLSQLRKKYWVIGNSGTIRHYLADCIRCRHARAQPSTQKMSPLPNQRLMMGFPAFAFSAVDYFGPMVVRVGRHTEKRWGCLFTCLTTRAVHLDVSYGLSSDQFLLTFRRFLSLYPGVKELLSDNATNFHAADLELKREFQKIKLADIAKGLRKDGISFFWKFNTPKASHQGGVFERLIGLVRSCIRKVKEASAYRTPSDPVLATMLAEIAAILNARPLCPVGSDPESYDVITPAQILRPGTPAEPQRVREFTSEEALRDGYRRSQWYAQEFWRHFTLGYLPLLQKRAKWLNVRNVFAAGDIVLVTEKDTPRYLWRLGRVISLLPSTDGLVRKLRIRLANRSELERDVRYVCKLEAAPFEES